jgi:hypothetical protein
VTDIHEEGTIVDTLNSCVIANQIEFSILF